MCGTAGEGGLYCWFTHCSGQGGGLSELGLGEAAGKADRSHPVGSGQMQRAWDGEVLHLALGTWLGRWPRAAGRGERGRAHMRGHCDF